MTDRILIEISRWDPRLLPLALRRWWRGLGTAEPLVVWIGLAAATLAIAAGVLAARP